MGRWHSRPPGTDRDVDPIGWLDSGPETMGAVIGGGVVLPAALVAAGVYCIVTQHGVVVGRAWHEVHGTAAIALGVSLLGAAVFAHAHAFWWGAVRGSFLVHELGRIVGAAVFLGGFGHVIWAMLWPPA